MFGLLTERDLLLPQRDSHTETTYHGEMTHQPMRFVCSFVVLLGFSQVATGADGLNVLFITLDDMNRDSIGAYGAKVVGTTPHIDRLAAEGLCFEHGHVTIAICQPTRAVWMTGRYPHNSGALGFNKINPGVPTLPETLRRRGFLTGILGKTEHVVPSRKKAFEYSRGRTELHNGRSRNLYGRYVAEFLIKARTSGRPFFLMVNTHDPHRPFDKRTPADKRKAGKAVKRVNKKGVKKTRYVGDYPVPSRIYQPSEIVVPGFLPDLPDIREEMARYYSSVRRADDVVGRVLAELEKAGFRENTIVMLKSDHGMPLPFAKTNVWRHSTLVPWIVRWPGRIKAGSRDVDHLVAGVDLAPTLLDVLEVDPLEGMDGRSFKTVLEGNKQPGRDFVFTHINTIASGRSYTMRSLQGKRFGLIWNGWSDGKTVFKNESMSGLTWKAMVRASQVDEKLAARVRHFSLRTRFEFYDYGRDPDALNNLFGSGQHQSLVAEYRSRLDHVMRSTRDPAASRFTKSGRGPGRDSD